MDIIKDWFKRHLSDPQLVSLILILGGITVTIYFAGAILAPVIAAVVIAYLLQSLVTQVQRAGLPYRGAVYVVFLAFFALLVMGVFGLLPLLIRQVSQLAQQIPMMLGKARELLLQLPSRYPALFSEEQMTEITAGLRSSSVEFGQTLLSYSLSSVFAFVTIVIYLILVPLMVYFMMKDKDKILKWLSNFLPKDRQLSDTVWQEVNDQIGNYVRGKFWEIIIVGSAAYTAFALLGLQYALLLAALTGFSVLIPFVGAAVVSVPVILVSLFQWGLSTEFYWPVVAYGIIQALDGNLLAPLLFSEAVNLHPVAIIVAILFFGGLWGFWGVFFAIPLATVIQAVVKAWPRQREMEAESPAGDG